MKTILKIILLFFVFTLQANDKSPKRGSGKDAYYELDELVVKSKKHQVLHILAYVRDYSTLTTYSDTVCMFREKWVDFMVPDMQTKRFEGWLSPRILKSKSYYRFTNGCGLDSVSDRFNQHFSWTDWVGVIDRVDIPDRIKYTKAIADTVYGKYSPTEIWEREADDIFLSVNVLADSASQRWAPDFDPFFNKNLDFEKFLISYDFRDVNEDKVYARDLKGITCNIESRGRGHNMFMFNRRDEPFFVTTYAEIYFIDKSYITVSEAKKWRENNSDTLEHDFLAMTDAVPELPQDVAILVDRVNNIDHIGRRLNTKLDYRLMGKEYPPPTLKQRIIRRLKSLIGL